ncbi:MAG: 50S ribosomal protein L19 [Deltaproteobacteria bacterium]|nr:50S ribosomal protein L19 [Deltaproteobacteria bacterium]
MSGVLPQVEEIEKAQHRAVPLTEFRTGDTVRVHYQIVEGEKARVQVFQGVVIRMKGKKGHSRATFTVRKVSYNIGVERTFLYNSPRLVQIDVLSPGKVRQSRLYYMRGRRGKSARIAERQTFRPNTASKAPAAVEKPEEEPAEDAAQE